MYRKGMQPALLTKGTAPDAPSTRQPVHHLNMAAPKSHCALQAAAIGAADKDPSIQCPQCDIAIGPSQVFTGLALKQASNTDLPPPPKSQGRKGRSAVSGKIATNEWVSSAKIRELLRVLNQLRQQNEDL